MGVSALSSTQRGVIPRISSSRLRNIPQRQLCNSRHSVPVLSKTPLSASKASALTPDSLSHDGLRLRVSAGLHPWISQEEAFSLRSATQLRGGGSVTNARRAVVCAVFERFTERAIRAIMAAQKEASGMRRKEVATEQLLLGLIAVEEKAANGQGAFASMGIIAERVREAFQSLLAEGLLLSASIATDAPEKTPTEIPFSLGSKQVFEAALDESRKLRHNFIAPEHLLLALLTVETDGALKILSKLGVKADKLRADALARLKGELADEGRSTATLSGAGARAPTPPPAMAGALSSSTSVLSRPANRGDKDVLGELCVDLTARAAEGKVDPVIGREAEVQRVVQILGRRRKNSPMLLGEPGVGKTAIAEGLALRIADKDVPEFLQNKRVLALDLGLLLAGTKERGELEKRINTIISEALAAGNVILVIDEIHTMVGMGAVSRGGAAGSGLDVANLLKPALSRGQLQCIGATTLREFRKHVEKDKALARRFQAVDVKEPSPDDALRILRGLRSRYEEFHQCRISDEALEAAVELSVRYIPDRYLPDKAIDLVDEAGSRARIDNHERRRVRESSVLAGSPEEYWREIRAVQAGQEAVLVKASSALSSLGSLISSSIESAAAAAAAAAAGPAASAGHPGPRAGTADSPAKERKSEYERRMEDYDRGLVVVGAAEIAAVASMWSGVPLQRLTADETEQLAGLEASLAKRVIGQREAVSAIARAVKRSRLGLRDGRRPMAALLFCGPTGVGKTELARALAQHYFGTEEAMIRLDMSEYMERHAVSKLVGAPPGYVGYDDAGKLTEAVRRRPFALVLFDEIEKAHPDFFNILLQIFEDGRLTDSKGRVVSFKNTLIVMTSNVGSAIIARGGASRIGFVLPGADDEDAADGGRYAALKETVQEELKGHFRPELLNRIDEVVVFRSLEMAQVRAIVDKMLGESVDRLFKRGIRLEVTEAVVARVCAEGYDRAYGARPLRRALMQLVEDPVAESLLVDPAYAAGDTALVDLDEGGAVTVTRLPRPDVRAHGLRLQLVRVPASVAAAYSHPD